MGVEDARARLPALVPSTPDRQGLAAWAPITGPTRPSWTFLANVARGEAAGGRNVDCAHHARDALTAVPAGDGAGPRVALLAWGCARSARDARLMDRVLSALGDWGGPTADVVLRVIIQPLSPKGADAARARLTARLPAAGAEDAATLRLALAFLADDPVVVRRALTDPCRSPELAGFHGVGDEPTPVAPRAACVA